MHSSPRTRVDTLNPSSNTNHWWRAPSASTSEVPRARTVDTASRHATPGPRHTEKQHSGIQNPHPGIQNAYRHP
eukprot:364289-Chlamydomonas_euryale.AAC.7